MVEMKYLTEAQVAKLFNIKPLTLAKLRRSGQGPKFFRVGGSIRYLEETVLKWVKDKQR